MLARNNLDLTKACVESALKQTLNTPVLVINNASTDGTANWLRCNTQVGRVSFRECRSVAASWNYGLDLSWRMGYSHAIMVNNDTVLRPDTDEILAGIIGREEAGLASGVSVDTREQMGEPFEEQLSLHPDFSCFMMAKWAHMRVRFDEEYAGAYAEDNDFHVRAHRAGIKCINTNLRFLHHRSSTIKNADPEERKRIEQQAHNNRLRFHKIYGCYPGTKGYQDLFT